MSNLAEAVERPALQAEIKRLKARFCVLKSPKQTECHFWHLHPAHYCGQPESAHRRKP
jgi:hypothetical protein